MTDRSQQIIEQALQSFRTIGMYLQRQRVGDWFDTDLTIAQLKALFAIAAQGVVHGRALAECLGVGQPAISKVVDQLVERGYVQREEDRDDRRIVWLRATPAGQRMFEQLWLTREEHATRLFAQLNDDDLRLVNDAMARLARAAESLLRAASQTKSAEES